MQKMATIRIETPRKLHRPGKRPQQFMVNRIQKNQNPIQINVIKSHVITRPIIQKTTNPINN